MLKKLLKSSSILLVLIFSQITFGQTLSDSLKEAVIISENPPKSYKKKELDVEISLFSTTLSDVLENQSTVYVKSYGKGQLSSISVRGTGASQTQLYWNGFKINSPTLGQTDLALLPVFFTDNAQLNYGNISMKDGSGGLGGSVQLNNKLTLNEGIGFLVGQEVASFNNYTSQLEFNYGTKKAQHQFKGMYLSGENNFSFSDISQRNKPVVKQKHNEVKQTGLQYSGLYKLGNKDLISTTLFYFNSNRNLPAIIGAAESKQNQKDKNLRTIVEWKSYRENYTGNFKLSFFNENMDYTDSISRIFSNTKVNTLQSQYKIGFKIKSIDIEPLIQTNYSQVNSEGYANLVDRLENSLLLKVQQKNKRFGYDLMLRQSSIDDKLTPFIYGLGTNFDLIDDEKLITKFTLSKNYRYPTLNDLYWSVGGNKNLKPEEGLTSELGVESKIKQHSLSLYAFYGVINNWIQWQPTSSNYWTPVNLKSVENKGIDFEYNYSTNKKEKLNWKITLAYGYVSSINRKSINEFDNTIGKTLIYVPNHKVSFSGEIALKIIKFKYTQQYTSKVFIDASNSIYLPYYMPAQLEVKKDIKINKTGILQASFTIGNLYNEPYQVVANRPEPGIHYAFSIRYGLE